VSNSSKAPQVTTRIKQIVRFDDDDLFHLFSAASYIYIILIMKKLVWNLCDMMIKLPRRNF